MENSSYIRVIEQYFMCSKELAKKIIRSSEINNTKRELDKIVLEKMKDGGKN